jgi:hypothetical protein
LRGLQYSSRLGDEIRDSRNRLERFFNNSTNTSRNNNISSQNVQPAETVAVSASFRSDAVRNEIQELRSQQRVRNVLTTAGEAIERTLINFREPRTLNQSAIPPQPPQPPQTLPVAAQETTNTNQVNATEPWLSRTGVFSVEQLTREQVLTEMNDLVNQQLVSSILRSDFRSRLEDRILDRLRRAGTDGERTRRFVQEAVASAQIPRNTGENGGGAQQRPAHRPQFANANEVRELRDEIGELKNLLKLSFDLQLDMQRSFKQEVSALVANTFRDSASARLVNTSRISQEGQCVICTDSQVDSVFYMCGHMCACYVCSMNLKQKNHNCPVCRAPIKDIVRVFKANLE